MPVAMPAHNGVFYEFTVTSVSVGYSELLNAQERQIMMNKIYRALTVLPNAVFYK